MRPFATSALVLGFSALTALTVACSGSSRDGFEPEQKKDETTPPPPSGNLGGDGGTAAPSDAGPKEINEVFGHSADQLYRLDPQTKAVTVVGSFNGCEAVADIALDESSTMYATSLGGIGSPAGLYKIDKQTAECTLIKAGDYPNSLSFVPKGTLDANEEALVGYLDATYVRIDRASGQISNIGSLNKTGFVSSGDVVSVQGGSTYLTIKRNSGSGTINGSKCDTVDCLVEVDPVTGAIVKQWGSIEHKSVFGLAFWGGKVYGFADNKLFEVTFGTNQVATSLITIPGSPSGLKFWGAGSATSVPLVSTPQ